ncbi:glycosyltransferase family 2 protein [Tabrizicola sp. J26]|uniref:glycosyltransferase family 2 protein n=1 Tax=Alitabrizicola rongguiensis TaxID=2909234 RepID=UPI001F2DA34B|nr:glycosyltransferase family A protein [Tabrizicola rongguiensis]MCF1708568.1 glycosyltransferase family 2 protein [Tabrizicola rongguiensis]
MTSVSPLVSVIIPAFNEELHISGAIESVLLQKVDFPIEVIVVDDRSSDATFEVACSYAQNDARLTVLQNDVNRGKGFSVRRAYNAARGIYVHILDADDVFSNWDKLQRQVDILQARSDCFAVGHNTLFLQPDNQVRVTPGISADVVYDYAGCYRGRFYCHTSSYLFRRLPDGLPEYFERDTMRGDTAFFFYHAFRWRKSVYVLKQVMSVYNIHGEGIWSSLQPLARAELNIAILRDLQDLVVIDPERPEAKALTTRIEWNESLARLHVESGAAPQTSYIPLETLAQSCEKTAAKIFRPDIRAVAFQGTYSLPDVDATMETIGQALLQRKGFRVKDRQYDANRAVLLVSGFVPNGGGIFREIKEIVRGLLDCGMKVDIISTGRIATDQEIVLTHFGDPEITYRQLDISKGTVERIADAIDIVEQLAPDRLYPFITHHDVVGLAAMQRGLARRLVFDFVYDHGLSLGVHSSSIDTIVTKTNSQASGLAPVIPASRLALLAPFFTDRLATNPYVPLRNGILTTASAAARAYKIESDYRYSYFDLVAEALEALDLRHIHYGPLSDDAKATFVERLAHAGVPEDRFVHIPWAADFGHSLVEEGVDVFIAPFPICSARIGIEVMSCGIPSLNHRSSLPGLPEAGDFSDPNQPNWYTPGDFLAALSAMDASRLSDLSRSAREYFETHNDSKVSLRRFADMDFDTPTLDPYPRFRLNDLALEPFFEEPKAPAPTEKAPAPAEEERPEVVPELGPAQVRFWRRTPGRRRLRAFFYRMKGVSVDI